MPYSLSAKQAKVAKKLCTALLKEAGGASAVANSLGSKRQYIFTDMAQGYVPLKRVYDICTLLNVSPWALSYVKLAQVFGEQAPQLKSVIQESPLLTSKKKELLADL